MFVKAFGNVAAFRYLADDQELQNAMTQPLE